MELAPVGLGRDAIEIRLARVSGYKKHSSNKIAIIIITTMTGIFLFIDTPKINKKGYLINSLP